MTNFLSLVILIGACIALVSTLLARKARKLTASAEALHDLAIAEELDGGTHERVDTLFRMAYKQRTQAYAWTDLAHSARVLTVPVLIAATIVLAAVR